MTTQLPGKHPAVLAINAVLQDGDWHPFSEFLIVVRPKLSPERASRAWLHEEKYRIKRLKKFNLENMEQEIAKTPYAARVTRGVRRFTANRLSRLVVNGAVERVKLNGVNKYRLTPKEEYV